jgi:RimJ/RimL family protein N-acetyltransferase
VFETPRLILRDFVPEDVELLYPILSDSETMSFWPRPFTKKETDVWIERNILSYMQNGFGRWAVLLKETGELIGDVGIHMSEVDGKSEVSLGYIIDKKHWNRGYATEASLKSMEHAFAALSIDRLVATMAHDNTPSIVVAEKIGMKKEREYFNKRNRNILTFIYSIKRD